MADKVYGLMDSLRLNQVELKRIEAENTAKQKKFSNTEKLIANIQSKISMELDAKQIAEQEKRDADAESALLKKKNKKIEESVATAQNMQEQIGKHIVELNEQINALQTQNAYLASRIDGQEEEKSSLKGEIKKACDRFAEMSKTNNALREEIDKLDLSLADIRETAVNIRAELEYVKREDVLDETGRQRPILIQSNESTLLEKLQINEFLYEAQQNKNPVPSLVEKLAQLLELLHTAQGHCDQYLGDLAKSNSLVSALRQKNLVLFEKTSMFESYKTRALVRYMMNLFESGDHHNINLDGLNLTPRELQELTSLLQRYQITEKVYFISLAENGLTDDAVNQLLQLVMQTPYLKALDLRRNALTGGGIQKINEQLRVMEGVTSVIKTATGQINVHSGNQLRICVEVADQGARYVSEDPTEERLDPNFNVRGADEFLGTAGGLTALGGQDMYGKATEPKQNGDKLPNVAQGGKAKAKAKGGAARKKVPPPLFLHEKGGAAGGAQSRAAANKDRFARNARSPPMESVGSPNSSRLHSPPTSSGRGSGRRGINYIEGEHQHGYPPASSSLHHASSYPPASSGAGSTRPLSGGVPLQSNNARSSQSTRPLSSGSGGAAPGSSSAAHQHYNLSAFDAPPRLVGQDLALGRNASASMSPDKKKPGWQANIDLSQGPNMRGGGGPLVAGGAGGVTGGGGGMPQFTVKHENSSREGYGYGGGTSRTTARTMSQNAGTARSSVRGSRIPSERVLDKWQTGNWHPDKMEVGGNNKPPIRNNYVG
eukprot:g2345.t1